MNQEFLLSDRKMRVLARTQQLKRVLGHLNSFILTMVLWCGMHLCLNMTTTSNQTAALNPLAKLLTFASRGNAVLHGGADSGNPSQDPALIVVYECRHNLKATLNNHQTIDNGFKLHFGKCTMSSALYVKCLLKLTKCD